LKIEYHGIKLRISKYRKMKNCELKKITALKVLTLAVLFPKTAKYWIPIRK